MKVDLMFAGDVPAITTTAKAAEKAGLDGFLVPETSHDAFLNLAVAAVGTSEIQLGSAIAIAFARTPMTVAVSACDLQRLSGGRLLLGLGTQIRPHITKRYGMPWSHPAARMREFVTAIRAIWRSWQDGTKLDFRGDFYTHTLMTPMFDPGPLPYAAPRIVLAAVGTEMTRVAGEVADGVICHPLTTPRYLADTMRPLLPGGEFTIAGEVLVATGVGEDELSAAIEATRRQVAFYASTPAYRPILDQHGCGELQSELNVLSKRGAWTDMAKLITDEILTTFAVVAEPDRVGETVSQRFAGLLDRVTLVFPRKPRLDTALTASRSVQAAAAAVTR
ncbi:TIGR03617 family F420-dependent LLM class oxidoreductase [Amycolatopsis pigmentata]|uniref:TIGR03617 family F420-dependent LLM class oxidoreductase n=1 Tax=Amycolatopsis pigmentata TaxID=450801 RepID=A0ABW5G6F1_9PSEU